MAGLLHLQHLGLGAAADRDLLAMDRERLPRAVVQRGRPFGVELLPVEVLRVAPDVRASPRDPIVVPEQDAGGERERYAADVHARGDQVDLEPDRGDLGEHVGIVR